jgi:hypothetical protein
MLAREFKEWPDKAVGRKYDLRDYVGLRFGDLLVTGRWEKSENGQTYWELRCSCGNLTKRPPSILLSGKRTRCRECSDSYLTGSKRANWKGTKDIPKDFFNTLCRNAEIRRKDISVDLTIEDLQEVYEEQGGLCFYTKLPLSFTKCDIKGTASVDRIDSNKGYTRDNIHFVHKDINRMKSDLTESRFLELCKLVTGECES